MRRNKGRLLLSERHTFNYNNPLKRLKSLQTLLENKEEKKKNLK